VGGGGGGGGVHRAHMTWDVARANRMLSP